MLQGCPEDSLQNPALLNIVMDPKSLQLMLMMLGMDGDGGCLVWLLPKRLHIISTWCGWVVFRMLGLNGL